MGVRVILRKNGVTYIGGDIHPDIKLEDINPFNTGVQIISFQLIVAKTTSSKVLSLLDINTEWLKFEDNEKITKEIVLRKIVNPLYKEAKKRGLIDKDTGFMDTTFYIICRDVTFQVLETFEIVEIHHYASCSYEEMIAYPHLYHNDMIGNPVEVIHDIMKSMYAHISYVQESYYIINNQDMMFHIFGGSQR